MRNQKHTRCVMMFCGVCAVAACQHSAGERSDTSVAVAASASSTSPEQNATSHLLVAGDNLRFIEHPEFLPVGFPSQVEPLLVKNPYEGDKHAIGVGGQLFVGYNCIDCHGAEGSGASPMIRSGC